MAFPVVAGFGGSNSGATGTSTIVNLQTLAGTASRGDLLIVAIYGTGTPSFVWPSGWKLGSGSQFDTGVRIVASGDSTSITITHSSAATAWQVYRIQVGTWYGGVAATAGWAETFSFGITSTTGTDALPDPPNANAIWGSSDVLWLAFAGNSGDVACTAGPTNYTNFQNDRWANASGCGISSARRELTASATNPGTFTLASSASWWARTIAIRPLTNGFPVVNHGTANSGGNVTTSTVDVANLTGTPSAGDLLLILISKDGTGTFTWPGGANDAFTVLTNYPQTMGGGSNQALLDARYRIANGSETTVAITHANESTAWVAIRIAAGTWGGAGNVLPESAATNGNSTNADPPSLNPANWDVENTLWIATAGWDGSVVASAAPTNYLGLVTEQVATGTGSGVSVAYRENAVASEDPGAFTSSAEQWGAGTIAVAPSRRGFPPVLSLQAVNRAGTY